MTPFHDDVFFEIDSARKLAAEFRSRRGGKEDASADGKKESEADGGDDEEDIKELAAEEERVAALARERTERKEQARAEARELAAEKSALRRSLVTEKARNRLEATEILRELEQARAEERAAAEETLRKACGSGENAGRGGLLGNAAAPADPIRSIWFPALGASQVWYFTAEGERRGPVTFAELRTMAASSVLDPRFDMVWKKGMDDWKPSGHIDGLFERSAFRDERAKESVKPVKPPPPAATLRSSALMEALASKNLVWPGVGRRGLWLIGLLFPVLWGRGVLHATPFLAGRLGGEATGKLLPWLDLVPWLVLAVLLVKRLSNLGMNRWWATALAIPVLNLWVAFRCLVCPPGYAYHKKMDVAGVALIVVLGLVIPAALFGIWRQPAMISSDHLQAVIHTAMRDAGRCAGGWF